MYLNAVHFVNTGELLRFLRTKQTELQKMAPRRGGGGYSSSYYGNDNPWSETVWLSLDYYYRDGYKTFFLTQFAFDILSLLAFVAFLIWACTIRNRSLPMKGLICALTSFIWYVERPELK